MHVKVKPFFSCKDLNFMQNWRQRQNKRDIWVCIDMISFVNGWTYLDRWCFGINELGETAELQVGKALNERKFGLKSSKRRVLFWKGLSFFLIDTANCWPLLRGTGFFSFFLFVFWEGLASLVRFLLLKLNQPNILLHKFYALVSIN